MRKFNPRKITVALLVLVAGFCFWQALPRTVSNTAAQILSPTATADITLTSASPSDLRTQAIESIKVGQRVLAKNPEISHLERRTRRAEPDFGRWLQLSLELPKPDGSTLHIEMLRSEEWVRNQIGFVIGENPNSSGERLGVSPPCTTATATPELNPSSPKTENFKPKTLADFCDSPLAPLSPLRPIFSDILFTSLAAEADGAELVGLTVQLDLPELGLTGEAILTDIQTNPVIEAPLDSRDERQVVTATFHHSSGDVIDLVVENPNDQSQMTNEVVDIGEGNKGNGGVLDSRLRGNDELAESGEPKAEIAARESEISDFKSPPCDYPKAENLKLNTCGEAETIGTTSNHPFWSEDRQEFVQAGSLEIGERLQTLSGDVKVVQQKLPRPGPQPVFNLEVHDEHVYFVGEDGVLVHNSGPNGQYAGAVGGSTLRERIDQTPTNGAWTGRRGNGRFTSASDDVAGVSIQYRNGRPDLSGHAKHTVEIDDFVTKVKNSKNPRRSLHLEADQIVATRLGIDASVIARFREKNRFTWHEVEDMKTLQLVPRAINAKFKHLGGIAEALRQ